jgi:hypothetical protein
MMIVIAKVFLSFMLRVTNKRRNISQSSSFGFVEKKGKQAGRQAGRVRE